MTSSRPPVARPKSHDAKRVKSFGVKSASVTNPVVLDTKAASGNANAKPPRAKPVVPEVMVTSGGKGTLPLTQAKPGIAEPRADANHERELVNVLVRRNPPSPHNPHIEQFHSHHAAPTI